MSWIVNEGSREFDGYFAGRLRIFADESLARRLFDVSDAKPFEFEDDATTASRAWYDSCREIDSSA